MLQKYLKNKNIYRLKIFKESNILQRALIYFIYYQIHLAYNQQLEPKLSINISMILTLTKQNPKNPSTPLKDIIQAKINSNHSNQKCRNQYSSTQKQFNHSVAFENKQNHKQNKVQHQQYFQPLFRDEIQNTQHKKLQQKIQQDQILHFESRQNQGYYQFQNWKLLNKKYFCKVSQKTVVQFWKILRILNFGEVLIPTGIIYEIVNSLRNQNDSIGQIRIILNQFFMFNDIDQKVQNFRQLANYLSLETIETQYKQSQKTKDQLFTKINSSKNRHRPSSCSSKYNNQSQLNQQVVFDRIYKDSYNRNQKKNEAIHKSLVKQLESCKFAPSIKNYNKNLFESQACTKPERICQNKQKWKTRQQDAEALIVYSSFKASEVDRSIYQTVMQDIPGVKQHISRSKYSTAQKQRVQRYLQRPTLVRNFY